MEKEKEKSDDDSASGLAWVWVIEYLASFKQVPMSLIHDIIENAPALPDGGRGKKAKEMIALRSLEEMFGSGSGSGSSIHHSKVTFDSSESCEDVLERILLETPQSSLRMGMGMGGAELLKWDVTSFIAHKRASLRPTLQQLKDLILDGTTHPHLDLDLDLDLLRDKSGLISVNKADNPVTLKKKNHDDDDDCIVLNTSSSHPQSSKETTKQCPWGERSMPASFSLLPSKRSRIDSSEDELPGPGSGSGSGSGCDDVSLTYKKLQLKQKQKQTLHSGEEGTSALFQKPHPSETQPEAVRDDTNHFGEFQMGSQLVKEHSRSANQDELHKVIDIENVEERLPVEENDYHVKETVAIDVDEEEEGTISDSDGYLNEKINIAMKKNELFSSQSTDDGSKLTLCMKCEKGGQLLSCNGRGCHLVVHEKCGSSMNDSDNVYCLFCAYLSTISQYLEAKKEAALQRKNLATFMRTCLEHQPIVNGPSPSR